MQSLVKVCGEMHANLQLLQNTGLQMDDDSVSYLLETVLKMNSGIIQTLSGNFTN